MSTSAVPMIELNDGNSMPAIGFGTYILKGRAGAEVMRAALDNGYRLLDSAFNYENEGAVGEAVRLSGVPRGEVFVTSKLPGRRHAYKEALETIEESLFRARLDYFDLYLIHWPNPARGLYVEAWQAFVEARKRGMVRSIGVSNFLPEHLSRLIQETGVTPAVNQVEQHPYFPQAEQLAAHRKYGIVTEAWSPLGRGNDLLHNPVLDAIARRLGKTVPQVILRWQVEQDVVPLPKAASPR
ncbi:MAG: aldo/keto reductase, partial [Methylobacteriaceae bacterium]|nr:aldo/keto reductase [Methylobacteriaceae bacterium]